MTPSLKSGRRVFTSICGFELQGRKDRGIAGKAQLRKVFTFQVQPDCLANIQGQFIQSGCLRDDPKVETFRYELAFASTDPYLYCSSHRFDHLTFQYALEKSSRT
jgi:hypothetical protein